MALAILHCTHSHRCCMQQYPWYVDCRACSMLVVAVILSSRVASTASAVCPHLLYSCPWRLNQRRPSTTLMSTAGFLAALVVGPYSYFSSRCDLLLHCLPDWRSWRCGERCFVFDLMCGLGLSDVFCCCGCFTWIIYTYCDVSCLPVCSIRIVDSEYLSSLD